MNNDTKMNRYVKVKIFILEYFNIAYSNSGGSPYPRMDGRKIVNLLQEGYRMPKTQHLDDKLYVNMVLLLLVFGFVCLFVFDGFYRTWCLSCFCSGCMCTSRFNIFTCWTSLMKGNERRSTLSRVYNCVIYLFSFDVKEREFATKKACSSRIGRTV